LLFADYANIIRPPYGLTRLPESTLLPAKSNAELKAEIRLLRRGDTALGVTSVFNNIVRFGALVLIARYGYLTIESLAGKATLASIGINFLGNLTISQSLAYIFGVGGISYGLGERWLRKKTTKRLGGRVPELEAKIDRRRTSSNLTDRGETPLDDKD
jgi:hypothetical protein